jgi:N,N'-diacetyllegionaminate synthase
MSVPNKFPPEGSVYVIAELASAAEGDVEKTFRLIDEARRAGADAVKFQFYKYDILTTPSYSKHETYKRIFNTAEERSRFVKRAVDAGLDVWVDIFDRWGLEVAAENAAGLTGVKIPPTVILDRKLVADILALGLPAAVGVGGYDDEQIDFVLSGLGEVSGPVILMYGFQGWPAAEEDTSLARIAYLKDRYGREVGFADHVDADSETALRMPEYALFAGARVIEKHITLDRKAKGLDYYSALEPDEFAKMVRNLRRGMRILGSVAITKGQKDYLDHATRVTATRPVAAGRVLSAADISFRRTDNTDALFPNQVSDYFPAVALRDLDRDAGVSPGDVRKARVGITVLCRLKSKRLPKKALLELNGEAAIDRCLANCLASRLADTVILATSTAEEDDDLASHAQMGRVELLRGSADDPAARLLEAAERFNLDFLVRVTGDSPLVSYELIDLLLESHFASGADFSYFADGPLGTRPEVISAAALRKLRSFADTDKHSEYLSLYFKNNPDIFSLNEVRAPGKYSRAEYRLNLDYPEDYELLKRVFEGLNAGSGAVSLEAVIDFLEARPGIAAINAGIEPAYKQPEMAEYLKKVTVISPRGRRRQ